MKYFLDTNIIIYFLKGSYPSLIEKFRSTPSKSIVIPCVAISEIEYGARKCRSYEDTIWKYNEFLSVFDSIPFNSSAAKKYGETRAYLEKIGTPIGPNDLMIASIVQANSGILVTHNTREFERIPGLVVEDWVLQ